MCGRYEFTPGEDNALLELVEQLNRRYADSPELPLLALGEVAPSQMAAVLTADGPRLMRWGFPRWQGGGVVINARSETAAEKSMFRASLLHRRMAVPTTGYYEWQRREGVKTKAKFLFRREDGLPMYLAGVYREAQEDTPARFVVLTTQANPSVATYHDRMPVLLSSKDLEAWFHGDFDGLLRRTPPPLTAQSVHGISQTSLLDELF